MKPKPSESLPPKDYRHYRNVRAVALWFIVLGSIFVLAGLSMFFVDDSKRDPQREEVPKPVCIVIAAVGLCGIVGGVATRRGNRTWGGYIKVMAVPYLFFFPIGTILSYILLTGLPRYFDSIDMINKVEEF